MVPVYLLIAVGVMVGWYLWLTKPPKARDEKYAIGTATMFAVFQPENAQTATPGLYVVGGTPWWPSEGEMSPLPLVLASPSVTASPVATRTAFWATDYVTRSVLLTEESIKSNGLVVTPTLEPTGYNWIATPSTKIIVVTSPPEIYVTEFYVNVPAPFPVVQTAVVVVTSTPSPSVTPSPTSTETATETATETPTVFLSPESTESVLLSTPEI